DRIARAAGRRRPPRALPAAARRRIGEGAGGWILRRQPADAPGDRQLDRRDARDRDADAQAVRGPQAHPGQRADGLGALRDSAGRTRKRVEKALKGPWTLPNFITLVRLAALPFFLLAIADDRFDIALGIFVAAGVSDGVDGFLARRFGMKSALGAYLDPIADK